MARPAPAANVAVSTGTDTTGKTATPGRFAASSAPGGAADMAAGRLRRLPVPWGQPPYDDEIGIPLEPPGGRYRRHHPPGDSGQGILAVAITTSGRRAAISPEPRPQLRVVSEPAQPTAAAPPGPPDRSAGYADVVATGPVLATAAGPAAPDRPADGGHAGALADPRQWAAKLAQGALESIYGQRPVKQLTRWTHETVYRALTERIARGTSRDPAARPRIRSLRVCRVNARITEASAVVQLGPRPLALALRLEAVDGRWLCTAFDLID